MVFSKEFTVRQHPVVFNKQFTETTPSGVNWQSATRQSLVGFNQQFCAEQRLSVFCRRLSARQSLLVFNKQFPVKGHTETRQGDKVTVVGGGDVKDKVFAPTFRRPSSRATRTPPYSLTQRGGIRAARKPNTSVSRLTVISGQPSQPAPNRTVWSHALSHAYR